MGDQRERVQAPPRRRGRLRPKRPSVPADLGGWIDDDDGEAGSAGVREPRRPKPSGPLSGAGELPVPEPPLYLKMADARR